MTTYHVIGDVHGYAAQLRELLNTLGWRQPSPREEPYRWVPPAGAQAIFVGDLVNRGPDNLGVLCTAMQMARDGHAHMVLGNHDVRAIEMLRGQLGLENPPKLALGRLMTWVELLGIGRVEKRAMLAFLESRPLFLELDEGRLLVTHARWSERFRRLGGVDLRRACAFGRAAEYESLGSREQLVDGTANSPYLELSPEEPLPPAARWVRSYDGQALVLWGHQFLRLGAVVRIRETVNVESGCFLGHALSAYVYPEGRVVQADGEGHTWKERLIPYSNMQDRVFPPSLEVVAQLLKQKGLTGFENYQLQLEQELEASGCPPLTPELERTHYRIFQRVVDEPKGPSGQR